MLLAHFQQELTSRYREHYYYKDSLHYSMFCLFQVTTLDEATHILPDAVWWVKADGVDVVSGLSESSHMEWSGDVDLNNGSIEEMHQAYINRLKFIDNVGVGTRRCTRRFVQT